MVSNIAQGTCGLTYNRGQKYVNSYQVQRSAAPKSRSLLPRSLDKRSTDPFRWTRAVGTRALGTVQCCGGSGDKGSGNKVGRYRVQCCFECARQKWN